MWFLWFELIVEWICSRYQHEAPIGQRDPPLPKEKRVNACLPQWHRTAHFWDVYGRSNKLMTARKGQDFVAARVEAWPAWRGGNTYS